MKKKTFDCVEMKREGSKRIYEALKGKSRDDQIEYWRNKNKELHQLKLQVQSQTKDTK